MKQLIFFILGLFCLASCTDSIEKKANTYYVLAEQAFKKGAYEVARGQIDSIRLNYPKAFETRRKAVKLRLEIDLAEAQQAVEESDGIIQQKTELVERMKNKMILEPVKGTVGNYVSPDQTLDKIAHNMLRAQVDEHGLLTLTSIYCGSLGHNAVKVESEGQSLQTPASSATFRSESNGVELEEAVFSNDHEVGISAFISQHVGKKVLLTYIGKSKNETITMNSSDTKAISDIYDLYLQMKILNDARVRYADACEKIKFIHKRMNGQEGSINADNE
jgi:hypothetical protein